jgi:hypothetical protein
VRNRVPSIYRQLGSLLEFGPILREPRTRRVRLPYMERARTADPGNGSRAKTRRRIRRLSTVAVASVLLGAAFALPLFSLHRLGSSAPPLHPRAPAFGNGTVSSGQLDGWTTLQGGKLSACATTGRFDAEDVQQAAGPGPNHLPGCGATAAGLGTADVLVTVSSPDLYTVADEKAHRPWTRGSGNSLRGWRAEERPCRQLPTPISFKRSGHHLPSGQSTTKVRRAARAQERSLTTPSSSMPVQVRCSPTTLHPRVSRRVRPSQRGSSPSS